MKSNVSGCFFSEHSVVAILIYLRTIVIKWRHYYVVFVFSCKQVVFSCKNIISSRWLCMLMYLKSVPLSGPPCTVNPLRSWAGAWDVLLTLSRTCWWAHTADHLCLYCSPISLIISVLCFRVWRPAELINVGLLAYVTHLAVYRVTESWLSGLDSRKPWFSRLPRPFTPHLKTPVLKSFAPLSFLLHLSMSMSMSIENV